MVTHLLVQVGGNACFSVSRRFSIACLMGAVVPDLTKGVIRWVDPLSKWWFYPFHSPVFLIVLIYAMSLIFHEKERPLVFWGLLAGAFVHVLVDHLQDALVSFYFPFFPFSFRTIIGGLFNPETPLHWLPATIVVALSCVWIGRVLAKKRGLPENAALG